jgi:hypothetical protein
LRGYELQVDDAGDRCELVVRGTGASVSVRGVSSPSDINIAITSVKSSLGWSAQASIE